MVLIGDGEAGRLQAPDKTVFTREHSGRTKKNSLAKPIAAGQ
jgi:hypothetical protein